MKPTTSVGIVPVHGPVIVVISTGLPPFRKSPSENTESIQEITLLSPDRIPDRILEGITFGNLSRVIDKPAGTSRGLPSRYRKIHNFTSFE
jgi:hypothetical protein